MSAPKAMYKYVSSVLLYAPVRALLCALAVHSTYYAAEVLHSKYCTPSFFWSVFSSSSSSCRALRNVSDLSRDYFPTFLAAVAYAAGSALRKKVV